MKPMLDRKREQEKFEQFLFMMDDLLEGFVKKASAKGYNLDYSLESLDRLEEYHTGTESGMDESTFIYDASQYLGEVVRKTYGGKWQLSIDDPTDVYYGFPVLVGHSPHDVGFCPYQVVRAFTMKKKRGLMRRAVENDINPEKLSLTPEK